MRLRYREGKPNEYTAYAAVNILLEGHPNIDAVYSYIGKECDADLGCPMIFALLLPKGEAVESHRVNDLADKIKSETGLPNLRIVDVRDLNEEDRFSLGVYGFRAASADNLNVMEYENESQTHGLMGSSSPISSRIIYLNYPDSPPILEFRENSELMQNRGFLFWRDAMRTGAIPKGAYLS